MHDVSFGVIPLRRLGGKWQVMMVQLHAGHWGFPKGHPNPGEIPVDCAERELREETGLRVVHWLDWPPESESYVFTHERRLIHKTVTYFAAEVKGELVSDPEELADARWVEIGQSEALATFEGLRGICRGVVDRLRDA